MFHSNLQRTLTEKNNTPARSKLEASGEDFDELGVANLGAPQPERVNLCDALKGDGEIAKAPQMGLPIFHGV
jgi:predicted outer membrane protein